MKLLARPPVVVVLGHVDHGKTSLLDYIRKSRLTAKEAGQITQRIGAYEVITKIKGYKTDKITFIDTPGHEAFSELRSRGANVADIAILIIDAKDSVMPQTIESISHVKAAKIPMIVAINKIDLPQANPEKVKSDLTKYEVLVEGKGGKIPVVNISALKGTGINDLLETILLIGADLNLTYNPNSPPKAFIIETKKDRRGIVVSAIIKDGCLKIGDVIYAEEKKAKIRSLLNDLSQPMEVVYPSTPFELLGFEELPSVGAEITNQSLIKNQPVKETAKIINQTINIEELLHSKQEEKKLKLIIKADSQGTLNSICNSVCQNKNIEIILRSVGDINRSDVFLAKTTKAIIVGFEVALPLEVKSLAKQEKVIIKTYSIIYELLEELTEVSQLLKEKEIEEKNYKGEAKILASFIIDQEKVFGVEITKGKINLGDNLEVYRNNNLIGKTKLVSLKIKAKKVAEVKKEQEAGMIFSPQLDIRIGDVVKSIL
ncbi:MAG: translation initiation factor IF-2 [Microgenomates group bacterium]|nr:translation initiation factor IF-2 [Microgenomates group bacterium]